MINPGIAAIGATILIVGAVAFYPNFRGYLSFRELCEQESGIRIIKPIKSGEGWTIDKRLDGPPEFPMQFPDVAFVRVLDRSDQKEYDYIRTPGKPIASRHLTRVPADLDKSPKYRYKFSTSQLPSPTRLGVSKDTVYEVASNEPIVVYTQFVFSKFNPDRTLFGAPSSERCPDDVAKVEKGVALPSLLYMQFSSAFTK